MDLKGSLVDTNVRIYPSQKLITFIQSLKFTNNIPDNIAKFTKSKGNLNKKKNEDSKTNSIHLTDKDMGHLKKVKEIMGKIESTKSISDSSSDNSLEKELKQNETNEKLAKEKPSKNKEKLEKDKDSQEKSDEAKTVEPRDGPYLIVSDVDWLYTQLKNLKENKENGDIPVPYLHEILEGSEVVMPENEVIKRNPVLEARCVKLRAQQDAREYRKMTRGVDNVRMRFPEDSISYQLKQVNRQLIAVGQFVLSIFAGFLFGFKGIEWMIGPMDFGFRLLLGVMIALVIALAEIYFLAKKLNEELNVPETVQLGGPPKFVDEAKNNTAKEHQD